MSPTYSIGDVEGYKWTATDMPPSLCERVSAPELLAELTAIEASITSILCSRVIDSATSTWLELRRNRDAARAAIARATGGNAS